MPTVDLRGEHSFNINAFHLKNSSQIAFQRLPLVDRITRTQHNLIE